MNIPPPPRYRLSRIFCEVEPAGVRALQWMKHRGRISLTYMIDTLARGPRMIVVTQDVMQDASRDDRPHCSGAFFS
jgi:hypothetical protein